MNVSLVCVSCGFKSKLLRSNRGGTYDRLGHFVVEEALRETIQHIVMVQGKDGSQWSKSVIKVTRGVIASAMYLEALDGVSVVFAGGILLLRPLGSVSK